jgi:D-beta-D-heptose 7-phosphate kinase/D-beta-D-heptose 1-phosphate adenosyltransferase
MKRNNPKKTAAKAKSKSSKKKIVVAVSGGFDPLHPGHVRMFAEAKKLGDELVVILNNDNWLLKKKGFVFMNEAERAEVISALSAVDRVIITSHEPNSEDTSVCVALAELRPDIFANGGDRLKNNIPEVILANKLGIKLIFGIGHGGKVESSSWLLKRYADGLKGPHKS